MNIQLSLRIVHPTIDPETISKELGLEPSVVRKVNEQKRTPKGTLLDGFNAHTFWSYKFPDSDRLGAIIESANKKLEAKHLFLTNLVESGGSIEYFIGCFIPNSFGDTLNKKLIADCAKLQINMSFDIYCSDLPK